MATACRLCCLSSLDARSGSQAWGQLSPLSLFKERERRKLACVNFFLFGFPTVSSPSPTVHNTIFALRPATRRKCVFSLFPPAAVQHELLQLYGSRGKPEMSTQTTPQTRQCGREKAGGKAAVQLRQEERLVERMAWQYLRAAPLETFGGACVTIPLKESLAPLLSHIEPVAKGIGAVRRGPLVFRPAPALFTSVVSAGSVVENSYAP